MLKDLLTWKKRVVYMRGVLVQKWPAPPPWQAPIHTTGLDYRARYFPIKPSFSVTDSHNSPTQWPIATTRGPHYPLDRWGGSGAKMIWPASHPSRASRHTIGLDYPGEQGRKNNPPNILVQKMIGTLGGPPDTRLDCTTELFGFNPPPQWAQLGSHSNPANKDEKITHPEKLPAKISCH